MSIMRLSGKNLAVISVIVLVTMIAIGSIGSTSKGNDRFFEDQHFHYETIRVIAHTPYGGADIGEVFAITRNIREGNTEDWYREWYAMAEKLRERAEGIADQKGRGYALLRAQNYYRNSEFYLHPEDARRKDTFTKSAGSFRTALSALDVNYTEFSVPYESVDLEAIYYVPEGNDHLRKPLIIAHGGYDSTLEELYFWFVAAALERGYAILTFSGPGQGAVIRNHGLPFTPEWEKPTSAVIDNFIQRFEVPNKIVLAGLSMGGVLAPRAAAFEPRIDGVIAFDAMYSFQDTLFYNLPEFARAPVKSLYEKRHYGVLDAIVGLKTKADLGAHWGIQNGKWVMGTDSASGVFQAFEPYHLKDAAKSIKSDVLLLWGEDDHFMDDAQLRDMQASLTSAKSVTTLSYSKGDGGHEHCQTGILTTVHADIFSWIGKTFPAY